jgi:hypothetical protein
MLLDSRLINFDPRIRDFEEGKARLISAKAAL